MYNNVNNNSSKLDSNKDNYNKMNDAINEFCNHKNDLMGSGWDEYRKVIERMQTPISKIEVYSSSLSENINSLQKDINSCFDSYSGSIKYPLGADPTDEIAIVNDNIQECKKTIANLEKQLYKEKIIYDSELGAIKGIELDEKVQELLERQKVFLENLKSYKDDLLANLEAIKNKYSVLFTNLLEDINKVNFE